MSYPLIVDEFIELVGISASSGNERIMADELIKKLVALGCTFVEDDAGEKVGGNTGNIIATLKGEENITPVLLSAHMDRVKHHGRICPIVLEGKVISDGSTILAADDVSGICAILEGLRQIRQANAPHGDIEIVFSVCEEIGVAGARHLDFSMLQSKLAYVFDAPGRLGRIVNQTPTKCKITIGVQGRAAHAGNEPEKGLNAIQVAAIALAQIKEGRISARTTVNFGVFHAGQSTNVVCDYAELIAECRSTDKAELEAYLWEIKQVFAKVAALYETKIDVQVETLYQTFYVDPTEPVARIAANAMQRMEIIPEFS